MVSHSAPANFGGEEFPAACQAAKQVAGNEQYNDQEYSRQHKLSSYACDYYQ